MRKADIVIIGGGCAGMAAALAAKENGAKDILIIERNAYLGGVLKQCIHNGFGVHRFNEDLTGTQYAAKYVERIQKEKIPYLTETIVLNVTKELVVSATNEKDGLFEIQAKAVILAMGCRERSRGALLIPGSRPAGVMNAGTAQRYMNIEGYLVGKNIVILGSGDIGLIMARQFTLEGAKVTAVAEIMPYSGGLMRNIVQCLNDFDIPLYFNTTVSRIVGKKRVEGVYLCEVDEHRRPKKETERYVKCDTLILSVGLIPENELSFAAGVTLSPTTQGAVVDDTLQTNLCGVFACGNVLHVHDLVDFVSMESERAGKNAALYVRGELEGADETVNVNDGLGVRGCVPQKIRIADSGTVTIQFRPSDKFYDSYVIVKSADRQIKKRKFSVLSPGEMCEIELNKEDITDDLTVEVVK